ncbi:hypothetical protein ACFFRR_006358 [Megaselia abdita]
MLSKIIASLLVVLTSFAYCERQLPTNTQPLSYYLSLTTYIHEEDYSFFGFVDIHIRALDTTDTITLHAENLDDLEVTLSDPEFDPPKIYKNLTFIQDEANDLLRIETPEEMVLQEGQEYTLRVSFVGEMTNDSFGFYKMDFADSENRRVVLAATHFENIFARRVFPCYDHPLYKAKFTIALTHGKDFKAYSNMPQDGPSLPMPDENVVTTKFHETPILPTYALAFIISNGYREYEVRDEESSIRQRIISEDIRDPRNLKFYSDFVSEAFKELESFFGPLEHLPKLDHISVPNTLSGAMENWGLIVYNAMYLDLTEDNPPSMRLSINSVLAHEIAHMWFGNTITVKNWENIWITESLATFYGWKFYQNTKPEWNVFNYSIRLINDNALINPTSLCLTRHHDEKNISSIEIYDYYKGSSLFKMIENVLSKKTMDKAVRHLISKYRYLNFDEDDFLTELQLAATEDKVSIFDHPGSIERVFKSWFYKPYFPIVTVTRAYDTGDLTISQHSSEQNETHLWDIPINFATSRDPNFENTSTEYLLPKVSILTLNGNGKFSLDHNEWLIMNKQQTGHYVVNYDQHNWEILAETLAYNHDSIHYLNRAQIVRDIMILHAKDLLSLEIAFDVLSYLSQETDLTVWRSARDTLLYFTNILNGGKAEEKFEQFVKELMKEILEVVKIQNSDPLENPFISDTRVLLLDLACEVDHEECLQWAKTQFVDYLNRRHSFDTGAFYTILYSGPKLLEDSEFTRAKRDLLYKYKNLLLYVGLLQNKNPENVEMLLEETLTKNQDYINAAFKSALLRADFEVVCRFFMGLSRKSQDIVLNKMFLASEKDGINYSALSKDNLTSDNLKKIFNDKLFALFQIAEEKLTTIPNYRLNPNFAKGDDAAFEWLSEYELSLVYPTEETVEVATPVFAPNEEESTFSAIFVEYDEESTTVKEERSIENSDEDTKDDAEQTYDIEVGLEVTTESPEEYYSEKEFDLLLPEEDSNEQETEAPTNEVETTTNKDPKKVEEKQIPSLSGGMLFRGLSFVTFMVVPFVILL